MVEYIDGGSLRAKIENEEVKGKFRLYVPKEIF